MRVCAEDLRPDDMVWFEGGPHAAFYDQGDEVVDRVVPGLASVDVWWAGWTKPVSHHPRDVFEVINRGK